MPDKDEKLEQTPLNGKLVSSDDPVTIGKNFRQLTNLRYTDTHPIGVPGMTAINTTGLSSYPTIKSGFHLRKDQPSESHVLVQAFNSGGTEAKIYDNTTTIPSAGDFSATALLTQSSSPGTARWSDAPHGNIIMCDTKGTYIWGGTELKVGAFIVYKPDRDFWKNYTSQVQNNESSGNENHASLSAKTESVDANTLLLLHLDNNVTDSGSTVHTVTNNNVTFSTSGEVFGTHWAVFTTNAYLSIPDHADFDTTGGTFTFDAHVQLDDLDADYSLYYQNMVATGDDDSINIMIDTDGAVLVRIKDGGTKQFSGAVDFKTADGVISAGTTYHIAIVESGDNWYIFVDGILKAYTSDAARAEAYDDPVKIGYDETTYLEGKIDEIRWSDSARWTSDFEVPLAAYGSATKRTYMYVGSPRPLQGIKFYVLTANTNSGGASSIDYWNGSAWAAVSNLSDGTATVDPFEKTGTMSFDSTEATAKPSIIDGIVLYWYRVSVTECNSGTDVYRVTIDAPMQTIKDTWDGEERSELSFRHWDNSANKYIDYTTNVYTTVFEAGAAETYANISSATTSDYFLTGFIDRQMGLTFSFVPGQENTTANTSATISYWSGNAWTSVGTLSDGTAKNGISFAQSGTISWNPLADGTEFTTDIAGEAPLFYYKITFSQALDASVQVYFVSGTAAPVTVKAYGYPLYAGDSVWLIDEVNGDRNKIMRSVPNHADTWNGSLKLEFQVGDSKQLMAGASIYMQIGTNLYEVIVVCKRSETWMIVPSADSLQKFLVDATKGCVAPATMKTASFGAKDAIGTKRNIIMWQGNDAIDMYDGRAVIEVSDDIADYFDRRKSYSINTAEIESSQAFFDENGHYHWLFASGTSTTLNKELVYDPERNKWYEIDRGTGKYLQCGIEVQDTTGNKYSYGCIAQVMERLENGTDFDGNDIIHTLYLGDKFLAGSVAHKTRVSSLGLTCLATNTTTNTISGSYYRDTNTTAEASFTLTPQDSGNRVARPVTQELKTPGSATYHGIKFQMTTNDEPIGFEPMFMNIWHKIIRKKLSGSS